jgi:hypothetical protein
MPTHPTLPPKEVDDFSDCIDPYAAALVNLERHAREEDELTKPIREEATSMHFPPNRSLFVLNNIIEL